MYSFTLSLTLALVGGCVANVTPRPIYRWERVPYPLWGGGRVAPNSL